MGRKTNLTLYVDKNLVKEAKELGINLSAFLEIKLREYLALVKSEGNSPAGIRTPVAGSKGPQD